MTGQGLGERQAGRRWEGSLLLLTVACPFGVAVLMKGKRKGKCRGSTTQTKLTLFPGYFGSFWLPTSHTNVRP